MRAAETPPRPPAPPPPTPGPKEASEARTLFLRTAWGLFLATGYSPKPTLGPVLELALERDPAILALRGFYGFESTSGKRTQRARFWVWGARLLPCYAPSITSHLSLAGCASLEHARVMTRGLENGVVVQGKRGNTPFWALGASLGVRLGLRRRLSVHADLGAEFPLLREKFAFTNEDGSLQPLLHRYPWLAARVDVGIGQSW